MNRWTGTFLIAVGAVSISASCAVAPDDSADEQGEETGTAASALTNGEHQVLVNGVQRAFRTFEPGWYTGAPANSKPQLPLLLLLHGGGGNDHFGHLIGMEDKADKDGFFVVSLQGLPCVTAPNCSNETGWNTGITPGSGNNADDVAFVRRLIQVLPSYWNVDMHRIYAAGFSNGGMMTYRLAAEMPDELAAVGIVEGTIGLSFGCDADCTTGCMCDTLSPTGSPPLCTAYDNKNAGGQIPIVIIHGKSDPTIRWDGDVQLPGCRFDPLPVSDASTYWRTQNGCGLFGTHTYSGGVDTVDFLGCSGNNNVKRYLVDGLDHHWWDSDVPGTQFSQNDAIWDFLYAHQNP
jgi:polyhydroxybutyrate depolymerase